MADVPQGVMGSTHTLGTRKSSMVELVLEPLLCGVHLMSETFQELL